MTDKTNGAEETAYSKEALQQKSGSAGDPLKPETDPETLVDGLKNGRLTPRQQETLAGLLVTDEPQAQQVTSVRQQMTMYSGNLPHPEHFNAYDEHTRKVILQMAVDDQKHTHDMQKTGLTGHINKDKRAQRYGLAIALGGFVAAAAIAPFSTVVAGIISALDIFGMVALFVAPRVLEGRGANKPEQSAPLNEDGRQSS